MEHSITSLISQYPVLNALAANLSAMDLFHLALTNREHFAQIAASAAVFERLRRLSLCDGRGLAARQAFRGLYTNYTIRWRQGSIYQDEPIEVRLYNVKCDEAGALPCRICGINVCEECRWYPRTPLNAGYPVRRPHLNGPWQNENIMCLCTTCDNKQEEEVKGQFLNELCDCDVFTRWICQKCKLQERKRVGEYYAKYTTSECDDDDDDDDPSTKRMADHQFDIYFYCKCGANVPHDMTPRCLWCKRRHLPESEWHIEWTDVGRWMPWLDNDPDYPFWKESYRDGYPDPYPQLGYIIRQPLTTAPTDPEPGPSERPTSA